MSRPRIAVIGGVAAGPAAAAEALRTDPEAEVVLFEQGPRISYGACEIPYYVAGDIEDADTLVALTPEKFERTRGGRVLVRHRVLSIQPQRGHLVVENRADGTTRHDRFDKFILAVGARPRLPDFAAVPTPSNLFPVRTLADGIALKAYLDAHAVNHAVILGGGYIGVEMAQALRDRNVRVSLLQPDGKVLGPYLDDPLRDRVHSTLTRHGVIIRPERAVGFDYDDRGAVRAVHTDRGEIIGCQLVVAAMGIIPNTELAVQAGVKTGATGALRVDDQMRTNLPNVWACGDCIEVERVIDGCPVHISLATVAFRTAHVAGCNAARRGRGRPARFAGISMATAVKVFDLEVATVGLRLAEARAAGFDAFATAIQHWSRVPFYPGAKRLDVRLVVERRQGRLLGAELVGEEGAVLRADVLVPLVREGWTVGRMLELDLIYTPPFAPAHDPLLVAAHRASKQVG